MPLLLGVYMYCAYLYLVLFTALLEKSYLRAHLFGIGRNKTS